MTRQNAFADSLGEGVSSGLTSYMNARERALALEREQAKTDAALKRSEAIRQETLALNRQNRLEDQDIKFITADVAGGLLPGETKKQYQLSRQPQQAPVLETDANLLSPAQNNPIQAQPLVGSKEQELMALESTPKEKLMPKYEPQYTEAKQTDLGMKKTIAGKTMSEAEKVRYDADQLKLPLQQRDAWKLAQLKAAQAGKATSGQINTDFMKMGQAVTDPTARKQSGLELAKVNAADSVSKLMETQVSTYMGRNVNLEKMSRVEREKAFNSITPQQRAELVNALARMVTGSAPALEQVRSLDPTSYVGHLSEAVQRIANEPTGTNQGKFIENMYASVVGERDLAARKHQNILKGHESTFGHLKKADPARFEEIMQSARNQSEADFVTALPRKDEAVAHPDAAKEARRQELLRKAGQI